MLCTYMVSMQSILVKWTHVVNNGKDPLLWHRLPVKTNYSFLSSSGPPNIVKAVATELMVTYSTGNRINDQAKPNASVMYGRQTLFEPDTKLELTNIQRLSGRSLFKKFSSILLSDRHLGTVVMSLLRIRVIGGHIFVHLLIVYLHALLP